MFNFSHLVSVFVFADSVQPGAVVVEDVRLLLLLPLEPLLRLLLPLELLLLLLSLELLLLLKLLLPLHVLLLLELLLPLHLLLLLKLLLLLLQPLLLRPLLWRSDLQDSLLGEERLQLVHPTVCGQLEGSVKIK